MKNRRWVTADPRTVYFDISVTNWRMWRPKTCGWEYRLRHEQSGSGPRGPEAPGPNEAKRVVRVRMREVPVMRGPPKMRLATYCPAYRRDNLPRIPKHILT